MFTNTFCAQRNLKIASHLKIFTYNFELIVFTSQIHGSQEVLDTSRNVPKSNSTSIIGDTLFCSASCNCHQVVGVYVHFYYLPSLQAVFANLEDTPLCQMISMSSKNLPNAKSRCPEISVSNLNNWTRMHSSRMHTAHDSIHLQGVCLSACWDTLP